MAASLFCFALFVSSLLAMKTTETVKLVLTSRSEPEEPHQYYSPEAKAAADKVMTLLMKEDYVSKAMDDYKVELAEGSDVLSETLALLRAAEEHRNCVGEKTKKDLSEIREKMREAPDKCASGYLQNERSEFESKGAEMMTKIREKDEQIKLNDILCTSLTVARSKECDKEKEKLERELGEIVLSFESDDNRSKEEDAFMAEKYRMKNCFAEVIKECENKLIIPKRKIDACKRNIDRLSSY